MSVGVTQNGGLNFGFAGRNLKGFFTRKLNFQSRMAVPLN